MNNLVFNTVASELKTSIYAQAPDSTIKVLQLDNDNQLKVTFGSQTISMAGIVAISNEILTVTGTVDISNPITISNDILTVYVDNSVTIANSITIANETLTVNGSVTISGITDGSLTVTLTDPITIANDILTVYVESPVTVANSITIANEVLTITGEVEVTNPITISNTLLDVNISSHNTETLYFISTTLSGTGTIFNNTNISKIKTGTLFTYNDSVTPFTLSLQMSPTMTTTDYIDDSNYTNVLIEPNSRNIFIINKFALYFRFSYNALSTTSLRVWYNGQT